MPSDSATEGVGRQRELRQKGGADVSETMEENNHSSASDGMVTRAATGGAVALRPASLTSDAQLIELWLHGRPATTMRAYAADGSRFRRLTAKPLRQVTLADLQAYSDGLAASGLSPAARNPEAGRREV